jgi:tetratricopeptide (TPR) repeat protein
MQFHELFFGGGYSFVAGEPELPCFYFGTRDLAQTARLLRGMYVDLSVREGEGGSLAYVLDVPDRQVRPWAIPLHAPDLPKLERAARLCDLCPTVIRDQEGLLLDLGDFAEGLEQDFSGRVARGLTALASGELGRAAELFAAVAADRVDGAPAAHYLLGRCQRDLGELEQAETSFLQAIRNAADVGTGQLIPFAATPLSDLAVLHKHQGETARAVHCFLHSLALRPNQPEALLSFFSLVGSDEALVLYGAARVLAIGPGREGMVRDYLAGWAERSGTALEHLWTRAQALAPSVDLVQWPLGGEVFRSLGQFERGLRAHANALAGLAHLAVAAAAKKGRLG